MLNTHYAQKEDFAFYYLAKAFIGLKEIKGKEHNPLIINFWKFNDDFKASDDETSWCAAFVNYCLEFTGYKSPRKPNARSFVNWGQKLETPQQGCIVTFWRGKKSGWQGHVGFYVNEDKDYVYVLGGNQGDEVKVSKLDKSRVLSYNLPTEQNDNYNNLLGYENAKKSTNEE